MSQIAPDSSGNNYLKQGALLTFVSVVAGFAADYAFNLSLSHSLSPHEYGDYKVAYAFAALASVMVLLGGDRVAPRILATPLAQGDNRPVWEYLRFYLLLACGLSVVIFAVTALAGYLHLGTSNLHNHHPLVLMSLVIPLIALGSLVSRILQAARHQAMSNLPWRVALPLFKALMVVALAATVTQLAIWQVIASGALAVILISGWQWYQVRRLDLLRLERFPEQFQRRETLRLSVPMMLTMMVTIALNQADLFMLEILASEHAVGHFAAASTTAHIISVTQVTLVGLFLPLIPTAIQAGQTSARALFWTGQRLIIITIWILALCLWLAGNWLLSLFGHAYQASESALVWLILAQSLWASIALCSTWMQYTSMGNKVVVAGLVAIAIDITCNLILIPRLGITGAAISTLISLGVGAALVAAQFILHQRHAEEGLFKAVS